MNIRFLRSKIRNRIPRVLAYALVTAVAVVTGASANAQLVSQGVSAGAGGNDYSALPSGVQIVQPSEVPTIADVSENRLPPGGLSQAINNESSVLQSEGVEQVGFYDLKGPRVRRCNGRCGNTCNMCQAATSMACGIPCNPYRYIVAEGLYLDRGGNEHFSLSRNFFIDDFDFEWTPRITFGSLPNCVNGLEFTFVGPMEHDRTLGLFSAGGGINTNLVADPGTNNAIIAPLLTPFQNSTAQIQTYSSEYYSGEMNRTLVGWDVVRLLLGMRFIRIEEDYLYSATSASGSGLLGSFTENNLLGAQIGLDMLNPVTRNIYVDFRGRAGVYLNMVENDFQLYNNGTLSIRNAVDDEDIAGVFEMGVSLRYQLTNRIAFRAGGEFWYLLGVAPAVEQFSPVITLQSGRATNIEEDFYYLGGVAGMEVRF